MTPGGPAEAAGLKAGDIIKKIGDSAVVNLRSMAEALKQHAPGDNVEVQILRGEEVMRFEVTLAAR